MKVAVLTLLAACWCGALAQFGDGPVPPRINIPGAIALGPKQGNFRQGRILQAPQQQQQPQQFQPGPGGLGPIRVRRPGPGQVRSGPTFKSAPTPPPPPPYLQQLEEQKPVTEEPDDVPESTPAPFLASTYAPFAQTDDIAQFLSTTQRQQPQEPIRLQQPIARPAPPAPIRFEPPPQRPQAPVRIAPLSYRPPRPQFRPETRPQIADEEESEEPVRQAYRPQPARQQPQAPVRQQIQPQQQQQQVANNKRERKPVAQVIRKYREDNPDGSITWGFENDDGSFKEETIGVDCVTRGRYGYVDPDGMKREYNYETGIPCDKDKKDDEEEKGFIDYQENKAVLPNGVVLDLDAMAKRSKRPRPQYRN